MTWLVLVEHPAMGYTLGVHSTLREAAEQIIRYSPRTGEWIRLEERP